jgi:hypothetical protein
MYKYIQWSCKYSTPSEAPLCRINPLVLHLPHVSELGNFGNAEAVWKTRSWQVSRGGTDPGSSTGWEVKLRQP